MRIYTKLLALLIVALTFGITTATASANRLSVSEEDAEMIWPEAEDINFAAGGNNVECSITLLGSFHSRTIRKIANLLVATVSHARIGDCDSGTAIIDAPPPWHVRYVGFTGTLPAISGVTIQLTGPRYTVSDPDTGGVCLTNAGVPAQSRINVGASGLVTSVTALSTPTIAIDDVGGSVICDLAGIGAFTGVARFTDLDGNLVVITLI